MKQCKIILMVMFLFFSENNYSQNIVLDSMDCSKVIMQMSYFWKLDSLANNGFRVYSFPNLLDCKIDNISGNYLIKKFGKPDTIWKSADRVSYIYFCFRRKALPDQGKNLFDDIYINFRFDVNEKKLLSIKHSYFDSN